MLAADICYAALSAIPMKANTMHNANTVSAPTIELTLTQFEKPMEVDLERFFEFTFDLAEDILDMESHFRQKQLASGNRGAGSGLLI